MTSQGTFPSRFALRSIAGMLVLALITATVAGLSLAGDADPKPKAEPSSTKTPDKPARPPEDEEPNAQPVKNHKVTVEGEAPTPKTAPAARAIDLRQAARDAKSIPIKNLFHKLAWPHDAMTRTYPTRTYPNIVPIPDYIGHNTDAITEPFKVTPINIDSGIREETVEVKRNYIESIKPYEEVALKEVNNFLNENYENARDPKEQMNRYDQDVAAEQVLTTVLLGLQSDRQTGRRAGKVWQDVEDELKKKLFGVLLEELNLLVKDGKWDPAFELTKRLAETYSAPGDETKIAQPLAGLILEALRSTDEKQNAEARQRMRLMEDLFPGNTALNECTIVLRQRAKKLIDQAKWELHNSGGKKNEASIGKLLNEAEDADPNAPDIRDLRIELTNERPTLRVGVRELPTLMSPAVAGSDSDLRAVELLFESLVKLHSDGDGGSRWEPGLPEGPPRMVPRGRQFQLAANGQWSNGKRITASDVRETVNLIQEGKIATRPPVWGALLDKVVVGEASRVNLTLPQGWLDPLALMNFKIVPSGSAPGSAAFVAHPVGSGPFKYNDAVHEDNGRPCVAFIANSHYGARFGKTDLPGIQNIYFIRYKDDDEMKLKETSHADDDQMKKETIRYNHLMKETKRYDLMLDLTAKEAAGLAEKANDLGLRLPAVAPTNRRIYFLAINHRTNPALANAAFRRALAYAINRDALVVDLKGVSLNGPYPAKSWACNPTFPLDSFNIEKAKASMAQAIKQGVRDNGLKLEYPKGDAALKSAMESLCKEVSKAINVTLTPVDKDPADLRKDVETTYSYDLAYYHYDFPDDVYWLGPLLDLRGGPGDQNYMGYAGALVPLIRDISRRRDFPEVQKYTYILHDKFLNEEMPFIPLWQLDALSAVSNRVVIPPEDRPFDPVRVFTNVERWRLKGE